MKAILTRAKYMTNEQKLHLALATLRGIVDYERSLKDTPGFDGAVWVMSYTGLNMCGYLDKDFGDLHAYPTEKENPQRWVAERQQCHAK